MFSKENKFQGGLVENMSTRFNALKTLESPAYSDSGLWRRLENLSKRLFDITVAFWGLVLLSPLFAVIALLIRRDSPGPVFYRGARMGWKGKVFYILKFRTMYERPASYEGPPLTAQDDPRITPLGRWLRITKLNELPQLWNVLIGDMSLVGPRPEDPEIAKSWSREVQAELLSVRPGITSPASVLFRDEEAMLQSGQLMEKYLGTIMPSKLRLDQLYVRHRSFLLDLDTLLWTFWVLLPKVVKVAPHENRLFWGPLTRLVRRHVSWFIIDSGITLLAISLTGIFFRSFGPLRVGYPKAIAIALVFALLYSISNAVLGLNRIGWSRASFMEALDLLPAISLATFIVLTMNRMWREQPLLPPQLILVAAMMASTGFVVVRYRGRLMNSLMLRWVRLTGTASRAQERVLIVGGGESGQFLSWWLQTASAGKAFRLVGFVDDDLYKQGARFHGVEVLGQRQDIPRLVEKYDVGIILFAVHNIPHSERDKLLEICNSTKVQVVTVPDVIGNLRLVSKGNGLDRARDNPGWQPEVAIGESAKTILQFSRVSGWLDELSEIAEKGDIQSLQTRIKELRSDLDAVVSR